MDVACREYSLTERHADVLKQVAITTCAVRLDMWCIK